MKICRVNMTEEKVTIEDVPQKYIMMGGRGLTSNIIADEVEATCHPLGKNNKIVIAPGLLSGTSAPSSGRLSIGFKSPLTKGIKESNAGGVTAQKLGKLGYKAIIIEGQPKSNKLYMLKVSKNGVELLDASDIQGKGNYDTSEILRKKYGEKVGVMSIGPAGEYKLTAASIATTDGEGHPTRHAGRGGGGAVFGSKGIKAIVIDDSGSEGVDVFDKEKFRAAAKDFAKILTEHPVSGQALPMYGTAVLVNLLNQAGGLPTKNFRHGEFEFADKISGELINDVITQRKGKPTHACHPGCVIRCSQVYHDKEGKYLTSGFEYETIWGFGANCLIDDIDAIAKLDYLCDDIGIDTIEMGGTIGVAMEGEVISFGDAEGAINLLEEVRNGTPLGRIIGNGAGFTGTAFGVTRVPIVKNQSMPAYDPRAVKGMGVTYATTPMGADHTAGYSVTANILKVGGHVDPLKKEGQVELSRNLQIATAAIDSTGLCLFVAFALLDNETALQKVVDMINAQCNLKLTTDDVTELGKSVLRVERAFNKRAGFTKTDDRLPDFFKEEVAPHNVVFDITDEELDEVYNF